MSDPKSARFTVRLSSDEDQHLRQLAKCWQVKRSKAVRILIQQSIHSSNVFVPIGIFTPIGSQPLQPVEIGGNHEST